MSSAAEVVTQPVQSACLSRRLLASRGLQMIVVALLVGGLAWLWIGSQGGPEVLRARFGPWAAALLVALQASISVTPFPDETIGFANAMIYGFVPGALLNWLGWMLGSYIEYAIARRAARDLNFDPERVSQRLPRLVPRLPPGHPAYLILARLLPLGGHVVNSSAGAFAVPLWRFTWTGALGMIPGSLLIAALATGLPHVTG